MQNSFNHMIKLTDRQKKALLFIGNYPLKVSTNRVAKQLDISWSRAKETLDALQRKGLIYQGGYAGNWLTEFGKQLNVYLYARDEI